MQVEAVGAVFIISHRRQVKPQRGAPSKSREVLGRVLLLGMEQPPPTLLTSRRTALRKGRCPQRPWARVGTCERITSATENKLRWGSSQQESRTNQCWTTSANSLAYTSQSTRNGLVPVHSSSKPSCFHSLKSSSICHLARSKAKA